MGVVLAAGAGAKRCLIKDKRDHATAEGWGLVVPEPPKQTGLGKQSAVEPEAREKAAITPKVANSLHLPMRADLLLRTCGGFASADAGACAIPARRDVALLRRSRDLNAFRRTTCAEAGRGGHATASLWPAPARQARPQRLRTEPGTRLIDFAEPSSPTAGCAATARA